MLQSGFGIKIQGVFSDPLAPTNGMIIYREDLQKFRKYENGSWSDMSGAAGANVSLSNLTSTNINENLIFWSNGNGGGFFPVPPPLPLRVIGTSDATTPGDNNITGSLLVTTGSSGVGSSGSLTIKTGNARWGGGIVFSGDLLLTTGDGATIGFGNDGRSGNSTLTTGQQLGGASLGPTGNTTVTTGNATWYPTGDTLITTGTSTNAAAGSVILRGAPGTTQGKIKIQDASNGTGTTGTIGHVWTQIAADGTGAWQALDTSLFGGYKALSGGAINFTTGPTAGAFTTDQNIITGANQFAEVYVRGEVDPQGDVGESLTWAKILLNGVELVSLQAGGGVVRYFGSNESLVKIIVPPSSTLILRHEQTGSSGPGPITRFRGSYTIFQ